MGRVKIQISPFLIMVSLTLSFILQSGEIEACLGASQNRIFPLGISEGRLCVFETHLRRTEYREKGKPVLELKAAWLGISYFNIYDDKLNILHSEVIDTINMFEQSEYLSVITKSFDRAMILAKSQEGFIQAQPESIFFCDYRKTCSHASLVFDTIKNDIGIVFEKHEYRVNPLYDSTSIASNFLNYYSNFDYEKNLATEFEDFLFINSVRRFQIGEESLCIVHIGSGNVFETASGGTYPPGNEYEAEFPFSDIDQSVFEESVMHHGHGFDFCFWR